MICVVIIVLCAIASFISTTKAANGPVEAERRALMEVKLGVQREFVRSKLGVPQNETHYKTVTCAAYQLPDADLYLIYDNKSSTLRFYSLTATSNSYHPVFDEWPLVRECVGCKSFAQLSTENDTTPLYFNFSAKFWV